MVAVAEEGAGFERGEEMVELELVAGWVEFAGAMLLFIALGAALGTAA